MKASTRQSEKQFLMSYSDIFNPAPQGTLLREWDRIPNSKEFQDQFT